MSDTDPRVAFFDEHAPRWDSFGPPAEETLSRLRDLQPMLRLAPGEDVLEVGCGTGAVTGWLAGIVAPGRVTAVDFSPQMLALARQRDVSADFRQFDVCAGPIADGAYDVAFCMHVFPHFRDPVAALRYLGQALRPGGRILILHLLGSQGVNAIHADAGPPVAHDLLPDVSAWPEFGAQTGLTLERAVDEEALLLVTYQRPI